MPDRDTARKTTQGLSGHRMERAIIKALLNGESPRQIAKWVKPPVSHITIWRFRETVLKPTLGNAETLKAALPPELTPKADISADPIEMPGNSVNQNDAENNGDTGSGKRGKRGKHDLIKAVSEMPDEVKQVAQKALAATVMLQIRENRIAAQAERHRRLQMIVEERAAEMENVPGGRSGFLTRDYKGSGDNIMEIYKFDAPLATAFLEHEKAIAIESGQWQENLPNQAVSIQILAPTAAGELPRVSYASDDAIEGGFAEIGVLQRPV